MHTKLTLFIFFLFVSDANAKRKKTEPKEKNTAFNTPVGATAASELSKLNNKIKQ